ncbi:hypothetical protein NDA01_28530 [Trichocoleus desertorum AS-A10]
MSQTSPFTTSGSSVAKGITCMKLFRRQLPYPLGDTPSVGSPDQNR